jgi:hypothetical protein
MMQFAGDPTSVDQENLINIQEFYSKRFMDTSDEGKTRLHYTTLVMVSNLYEVLKCMRIDCDEATYASGMDIMKADDMPTYVKLASTLLNPSSPTALEQTKIAFEYVSKDLNATMDHYLYLQLSMILTTSKFAVANSVSVNEGIQRLDQIVTHLLKLNPKTEMHEQ